jgi:hypothetical protein
MSALLPRPVPVGVWLDEDYAIAAAPAPFEISNFILLYDNR